MNKITEVTVTKLFGYEGNDYTVELLPDKPVTFIHGFNGIGKTTLLRLLHAALSYNIEVLQSIRFESLDIRFDTKESLVVTKEKFPELELENVCLSDSVAMSDDDNDIFTIWKDSNGFPVKIFLNETDLVPSGILKRRIHVNLWYANPLQDPNNVVSPDTTGEGTYCYKVLDKMDYLQRKIKEFKGDKKYEPKLICFMEVINGDSGLVNKSIDIDSSGNITVKVTNMKSDSLVKEDERPSSIYNLSSGEKNLLSLYFQLIFELPDPDGCQEDGMCLQLLDEPELSMHPDCLIDFYDTVEHINSSLGRGKNYQLLVATHSPLIAFEHSELVTPMWGGSDDSADNDDGTDR